MWGTSVRQRVPSDAGEVVVVAQLPQRAECVEGMKLLLAKGQGIDVDRAKKDGATPLFHAASRRLVEAIKVLANHGVDVNEATCPTWQSHH